MLKHSAKKFGYALTGLKIAWREEASFKIQIVCAVLALALGWALNLSLLEFVVVVFMISFVLTAEVFNTALEELCDKFQPTEDPHIAKIKDLAAAAVLLSSLGALVVGLGVFLPHL
jgi:undecaprenol kinase/diacylglycerol kinase (ATP)